MEGKGWGTGFFNDGADRSDNDCSNSGGGSSPSLNRSDNDCSNSGGGISPSLKKPKPSAGKEKSFDGVTFTIEWSMQQADGGGSGISNVLNYTGKLKSRHRGNFEEEDCGEINCTKLLRTNMANEGESLYDTCDCLDSELERVAHLVTSSWDETDSWDETEHEKMREQRMRLMFDQTMITAGDGKFINEVGDQWDILQGDILYVSKVKVKEEYRGMGLGLLLVEAADKQINSHESLTLLIPFPLVYDENRGMDRSNLMADMGRLAAYFGRIGFGSLGWPESVGSWFVARWNGYKTPNIKSVCPIATQFQ